MKKQSINRVIKNNLKSKISYGKSKYEAKKDLKFGQSSYRIYSFSTYSTYERECLKFGEWVKTEKGINSIKTVDDIKQYAQEYLQERLDKGCSVWTVKMEKSVLSMMCGEPIKMDMPKRDIKDIDRSRHDRNNHYSRDGQYKDVYTIALATGGRRADIEKLTPCDFKIKTVNYTLILNVLKAVETVLPM